MSTLFLGIHGGHLLGVRSVSGLAFYDWETTDLIRRIEISPKNVSTIVYQAVYLLNLGSNKWVYSSL